eukprot:COSAG02_NODE_7297_length_3079_cov_153.433221_4_plen_47_part_00
MYESLPLHELAILCSSRARALPMHIAPFSQYDPCSEYLHVYTIDLP